MRYLKRFNENMNLSNYPYINADDDELSFLVKFTTPGKLEIHGNEVYYDESDSEIMKVMKDTFPNDFKNGKRVKY